MLAIILIIKLLYYLVSNDFQGKEPGLWRPLGETEEQFPGWGLGWERDLSFHFEACQGMLPLALLWTRSGRKVILVKKHEEADLDQNYQFRFRIFLFICSEIYSEKHYQNVLSAVKKIVSNLILAWVFPSFREYLTILVIVKVCHEQQKNSNFNILHPVLPVVKEWIALCNPEHYLR